MAVAAKAKPLVGDQKPRLELVQPYVSTSGHEAIEIASLAGVDLDVWQQHVLVNALGEKPDATWAAPEVAAILPRQNGKNEILMVRELAGLFLLREGLIVHSAHQYDTSIEAYRRLKFVVENAPELDRRVKRYINAHGEEGIELKAAPTVSSGPGGLSRRAAPRIRFRTRTKGGGRGFSGDCVIFDESMIFPESSLAAILPIVSARPNPQIWYTGSAVDQAIHDYGLVLARVRARGMSGEDRRLAYFEWSVDAPNPADVDDDLANNRLAWAQANPALGIRISEEYVAGERASLGQRNFAVERLGVGDWPDPESVVEMVIQPDVWDRLEESHAVLADPVAFAFDVSPDRSSSCIAAAGFTPAGRPMVEVVAHQTGSVSWIVPWLQGRCADHKPLAVACDAVGAAAGLATALEGFGIEVQAFSAADHAKAAGAFFDDVTEGRLAHLGQRELSNAVRGATTRPLGGAWAWNRRTSAVDITPLVAATLALGAFRLKQAEPPKAKPGIVNLADLAG